MFCSHKLSERYGTMFDLAPIRKLDRNLKQIYVVQKYRILTRPTILPFHYGFFLKKKESDNISSIHLCAVIHLNLTCIYRHHLYYTRNARKEREIEIKKE